MNKVSDYLIAGNFSELKEGKNEFSENVYIVKIVGEKNPKFEGILEVHRDWIDIHIPLNTNDIISYKEISECKYLEKEYDIDNDYALYNEPTNRIVDIPQNYFCIIDTTMAHMAMIGSGTIEKLVVKVRK